MSDLKLQNYLFFLSNVPPTVLETPLLQQQVRKETKSTPKRHYKPKPTTYDVPSTAKVVKNTNSTLSTQERHYKPGDSAKVAKKTTSVTKRIYKPRKNAIRTPVEPQPTVLQQISGKPQNRGRPRKVLITYFISLKHAFRIGMVTIKHM